MGNYPPNNYPPVNGLDKSELLKRLRPYSFDELGLHPVVLQTSQTARGLLWAGGGFRVQVLGFKV